MVIFCCSGILKVLPELSPADTLLAGRHLNHYACFKIRNETAGLQFAGTANNCISSY